MADFLWHPGSVAALACGTLCLVAAGYLLSLPRLSGDGRRLTGFFVLQTAVQLIAVLASSIPPPSPWNVYGLQVQSAVVALLLPYGLWYVYAYRQVYFRREMHWVVGGSALLMALVWAAGPHPFAWFSPLYLLAALWQVSVLVRKTLHAARPAAPPAAGQAAAPQTPAGRAPVWQRGRALWQTLRRPPTREAQAQRALAFWSLSTLALGLNASLVYVGLTYSHTYWVVVHNALLLVQLAWLIVTYLNYAEETTAFFVKLVALVLCLTLFLLGQLGGLLYAERTEFDPAAAVHQPGLRTLAALVLLSAGFIVVVVPVFLRRNLLRPLREVLEGVARVNAGNLTQAVPVLVHDELGFLAQNFNHMTASLREYATQMEELVARRTTELEQQKAALQHTLGELRTTQAQLIQKEKMASLGELTAGVAHEMQNPLNFVTNFAELSVELMTELEEAQAAGQAAEAAALTADVRQNLVKITQHGQRAAGIVRGMLEHSGQGAGARTLTDLNALAAEYLRRAAQLPPVPDPARPVAVAVTTDFAADLPPLLLVPAEIGRVLLNMYANAFYAVRQQAAVLGADYCPAIHVGTRRRGAHVELHVRDNGTGIPAAVRAKVFQPFFTTKRAGEGTGLGLSLAYTIVTQGHGGTLTVESREGAGSEFVMALPV